MILNVSGRTDIVAFYTDWFMNRYREGFFDVRNPFYKQQVSRIYVEDVDAILFCTKNPIPIIPYLKEIENGIKNIDDKKLRTLFECQKEDIRSLPINMRIGLSVGHTCPTINFVLISIYELS